MKKGLSPLQEKFCKLYHKTGNATRSYINAGYQARGRIAESNSSRLLRNDKVRNRLQELEKAASKRAEKSIDDLIAKNVEIAFSRLSDVIEIYNGEVRLKDEGDLEVLDGISFSKSESSSSSDKGDSTSISKSLSVKRPDRIKALQEIARLTGVYEEKKRREEKEGDSEDRGSKLESILGSLNRFKK